MQTIVPFLLLLVHSPTAWTYGYDSGTDMSACGKPSRTARLYHPPCDLSKESFCAAAGTAYPWRAVRRFVRENQGLMRRMYGDRSHKLVMEAEREDEEDDESVNDVLSDDDLQVFRMRYQQRNQPDESAPRLLNDDAKLGEMLAAKFVYAEQQYKKKINEFELRNVPYFRPAAQKTPTTTTTTTPTSTHTSTSSTTRAETTTENATSASTILEPDGFGAKTEELATLTENVTEEVAITDEPTTEYLTTSEKNTEEGPTEAAQKKETVGEVLFQDMEEKRDKINHMNYKLKGVNACPVKEEVVAPFWANNTRGEILALLNIYPFEQYVHWEKCSFEHRQMYCREGCRCEQQYRLHRLLAYDPHNECRGIFSDWFRFPSCCVCKCYNIPPDVRVTSRSPRSRDKDLPSWFIT